LLLNQLLNLDYSGFDLIESAWASLLVNRLAYSGVSKANPLGGRKGSQKELLSRWNPTNLIKRIEKIHSLSDKIEITQENAVELIEEAYWQDDATIFIDPPYVKKGKDLYHCFYTEKDHRKLAYLLDTLYFGCPGADIVVTYDYNEWLNTLYDYPEREIIGRKYSA
jgi:DNA adenine methylase